MDSKLNKTNNLPNLIDNLPDELLLEIFSFFRLKDLPAASKVEKNWNALLHANDVFYTSKFGRTQHETKNVISTLPKAIKKQYLNKENFDVVPSNFHIKDINDLINLGLVSPQIDLSKSKSIITILLASGTGALLDGWITVEQAIQFSPAALTILLTKVYPSYKQEITPDQLLQIGIKHKEKVAFVHISMEETLNRIFVERDYLKKLNILGWNKLELINLFFGMLDILRDLLDSDISHIKKFFIPKQLAQLKRDVAYYILTPEGKEFLEKNVYSITQILSLHQNSNFNKNFTLLHSKEFGIELLKNNKIKFEDLELINHDVLYALLTQNTCQRVVDLNLISTTPFELGYSERELKSYCHNLLIALSEGLCKHEEALWFVNNKYQLFKEFISSNDGLNLLRSKQFNIEMLKTFDSRLFDDSFNGRLALIIKESITQTESKEKESPAQPFPNPYLNSIGRDSDNFAHYSFNNNNFGGDIELALAIEASLTNERTEEHSDQKLSNVNLPISSTFSLPKNQCVSSTNIDLKSLNSPILIELLEKLEPKARQLIDLNILKKVIENPVGLLAITDGLITLEEIHSSFDIEFELSEPMLEAKRATKTKKVSHETLTSMDFVSDTEETVEMEEEVNENQDDEYADEDVDQYNTSEDEAVEDNSSVMDLDDHPSSFGRKSP